MIEYSLDKKVNIHVGRKLRERRKSLKISQDKLGRELGITFQQIQKYERGINRVSCGTLYVMSEFLDAPITYFFDGLDLENTNENIPILSKEEKDILLKYNSIQDPNLRKLIISIIEAIGNKK